MGLKEAVLGTAFFAALTYALSIRKSQRPQRPAISEASVRLFALGKRVLVSRLLDNLGGFFGVDIGGSLTKMVFLMPSKEVTNSVIKKAPRSAAAIYKSELDAITAVSDFILNQTTYGRTGIRDVELSFEMPELGGTFHFIRFETRRMEGAMKIMKRNGLTSSVNRICTTGGGAVKFQEKFKETLGVQLDSEDEIDCLVRGMAFLLANVQEEAFTYEGNQRIFESRDNGIQYPFLLCNVGSGVGFILVSSEHEWQRVSGTSMGGGTYYGLCNMLTGITEFDKMLDLAELGDNSKVDLTVGDIYGGDYAKFGLKANAIAASFGKALLHPVTKGSLRRHAEEISAENYDDTENAKKQSDEVVSQMSDPFKYASENPDPSAPTPSVANIPSSTCDDEDEEEELQQNKSTFDISLKDDSLKNSYELPRTPRRNTSLNSLQTLVNSSLDTSSASNTPLKSGSEPGTSKSHNINSPSSSGVQGAAYDPKDLSRALLILLSNNIGQLAYLNALKYKCKDIYFAGNFLRHENTVALRTLSFAIKFWSKGTMAGLFLKHEGYCGALGAFLKSMEVSISASESQKK